MNQMNRIIALRTLALLILACALGDSAFAQTRVRLVAGNLSTGNFQSYDNGEGARIFKGLKPDVAMIQEFNYGDNSPAVLDGWVTSTFGANAHYKRGMTAQIPNGVISATYPIIESGEWTDPQVDNRDFVWARIDIPGDHNLWAISVHMLTTASKRPPEGVAIHDFIVARVPAEDYVVIGGDFNTKSRTETILNNISSVVVIAGPYPTDGRGLSSSENTNASRAEPYDLVLVESDLNAFQVPVLIGAKSFTGGLVFDSRVYTPLADVAPVLSGDSGAPSMQHMAIVKDFMIPSSTTTPTPTPIPIPDGFVVE
ncbi:hypothetical protein BH09SUM1_BH09SUM1_23000 [soil metagenome]